MVLLIRQTKHSGRPARSWKVSVFFPARRTPVSIAFPACCFPRESDYHCGGGECLRAPRNRADARLVGLASHSTSLGVSSDFVEGTSIHLSFAPFLLKCTVVLAVAHYSTLRRSGARAWHRAAYTAGARLRALLLGILTSYGFEKRVATHCLC